MSVTACILNNNELAGILGKKGTESDIHIYNRKIGEDSFTFFVPRSYPDKLSSLLQCIGGADIAVLYVDSITRELGEIIVALDSFGLEKGILVLEGISIEELAPIIRGTVVEKYVRSEKDYASLIENINGLAPEKKEGPVKVEIDHFFDVKSVGTVALGIVKRGVLEKYAKLEAMPLGKEVLIRSIQIHDTDVSSAACGSRVGVSLKGVKADELSRGSVLSEKASVRSGDKILVSFRKSSYYKEDLFDGQMVFLSIGMQYCPCQIERIQGEKMLLKMQKKIAYEHKAKAVLANQDSKGLKVIGGGRVEES